MSVERVPVWVLDTEVKNSNTIQEPLVHMLFCQHRGPPPPPQQKKQQTEKQENYVFFL